jgi:large subunit ribosomal protein L3
LQFWPRKRAAKPVPSVNWSPIFGTEDGVLGFLTYKVGMATALAKDSTEKSLTENKQVAVPVTILEAPPMRVVSVRFYQKGKVIKDVVVSVDKDLKRKMKMPKAVKDLEKETPEGYDEVRLLVASTPGFKKTPDVIEIAVESKDVLAFVKPLIGKEITLDQFKGALVDVRGLTKGKGMQGPVKRFGIGFKSHKSEKGVRNPGSIGPWHPARVTFRVPMAGQLGMFSRVHYNLPVVTTGNVSEKDINPKSGFKKYGPIKGNYIVVKGSVQGPAKRAILVTPSFRPTKKAAKQKLEFQRLVL